VTLALILPLAVSVLVTSLISGVFGMAGGILLVGLLLTLLPVSTAMVVHGATQMASNGWRAFLWRKAIIWRIVGWYCLGTAAALAMVAALRLSPSKATVMIVLGLVPIAGLLVPQRYAADATKPAHAALAGVLNTVLHVLAGATGPILDLFFVRSNLPRQSNVATKGTVQVVGHFVKVVYFGALLHAEGGSPDWPAVATGVVMAVVGTTLSRRLLEAIDDKQFYRWSRMIVLTISAVYLVRGLMLAVG